jgi:hypothetical protein
VESEEPEGAQAARSWIQAVASILDQLASTGNGPVRATEDPATCLGPECGSSSEARGSKAALVLLALIVGVAGSYAIGAQRRRSNAGAWTQGDSNP